MDKQKLIKEALATDPLQLAEEMTGKSYKVSKETESLGFALHVINDQVKQQLLREDDDTYFGQPLLDYMGIVESLGFKQVYAKTIPDTKDVNYIYWHPDGLLLKFDSYCGNQINGGKFYFNLKIRSYKEFYEASLPMSHEAIGEELVVAGDMDCREGLKHYILELRKVGEFLNPWVKDVWMWLLSYADTNDPNYNYHTINREIVSCLPKEVQESIAVAKKSLKEKRGQTNQ